MPSAWTFILPRFDDLPPSDVALNRLIAFSNRFDPTALLERLWGIGYAAKASETWLGHWHAFQAGEATPVSAVTLLFTLHYDIVSGANLYRVEAPGVNFHQWLVAGLRRTTRRQVAPIAEKVEAVVCARLHVINRKVHHAQHDAVAA